MTNPTDIAPDDHDARLLCEAHSHAGHEALAVCATCGELFREDRPGALGLSQRCGCRRTPDEARWDGFDFNEWACLCRCCGQVVLRSGSRWSVWFCQDCKEPIRGFNLTYGWQGTSIIPIGRHSLMNGIGLSPVEIEDLQRSERFVEDIKNLVGRSDLLSRWAADRVRLNLELVGLAGPSVPLREYLLETSRRALVDPRLTREAALVGLMAQFRVPVTTEDLDYFRRRIAEWMESVKQGRENE